MFNKKWYEWILLVTYIAMALLCVYLNFSPNHRESLATIIVNIVMFIIVAIIFISADLGSFGPMNSIIKDLKRASDKIRTDAMNTHSYLFEPYNSGNVELFSNKRLQEIYRDFIFELNRSDAKNSYYKPGIDDYINEELVDEVMHRNELNQVAGMLTGLGILGTFIGLSLGLQNFNTGTTAEMTNSIEPLMQGIKVAFHTSIYGMVFSLVFNAIYKKKLFDAERSVRHFANTFKKYVLPDTDNDGMNALISLQQDQLNAITDITDGISRELSAMINPHFEKLHTTINEFAEVATRAQTESMSKVVGYFIDEMNKSLGSSFTQMNNAVSEMYKAQSTNVTMMQDVLRVTGQSTGTLSDINRETASLVDTLNKYTASIQTIQNELSKTITELSLQDDASKKLVLHEQKMLAEQDALIQGFKTSLEELAKYSKKSNEQLSDSIIQMTDALYFVQKSLDKHESNKTARR